MAEPKPGEHRVKLTPLQAETVWRVEAGALIQRRGSQERVFPLAALKRVRRAPTGAVLVFERRRVTLPSRSYGTGFGLEDRSGSFEALLAQITAGASLAAPPPASPVSFFPTLPASGLITVVIGLLAFGTLAALALAVTTGATGLGIAFAARMAFVLMLVVAAMPWMARGRA